VRESSVKVRRILGEEAQLAQESTSCPARDAARLPRSECASTVVADLVAGGVEPHSSVVQKCGMLDDISADVAPLFQPNGTSAPEMNAHEHS
jgi:hypothetical protein